MTQRPTESQLATLDALNLAIAQIGDALGSESTNPGLVFITRAPDLQAAVREVMPETYQLVELDVAQLLARYVSASDPRRELVRALLARDPAGGTAGLCGGAFFKPTAADRGSFYVVVFLGVAAIAGWNLVVAFSRAET